MQFTLYVICVEKPKPSFFFFFFNQLFCICPNTVFFLNFYLIFFFFFFFGHITQLMGSWFSDQGLNPGPWQWEHGVLTSGPLGSSHNRFLKLFFPQCFHMPLLCIFGYTLRPRVFISSPYISSLGEPLFINWPAMVDCYCCL